PGTPILSVKLEAPSTTPLGTVFAVTLKFTYTGQVVGPDSKKTTTDRPITFRCWSVVASHDTNPSREGFWLYRHRPSDNSNDVSKEDAWEVCDMDDGSCGAFVIVNDPGKEVRVAMNSALTTDFTSLRPGETWTTSEMLQSVYWSLLPDDTAPGDRFRFCFKGAFVDWWDWGDLKEHEEAQTTVMLPCWEAGRVIVRETDKKMPTLVIPGADEMVEFVIVDGGPERRREIRVLIE
ncbi:hypothetical protein B0T21DRAFT_293332, partial [Apiosordaria backusii]